MVCEKEGKSLKTKTLPMVNDAMPTAPWSPEAAKWREAKNSCFTNCTFLNGNGY